MSALTHTPAELASALKVTVETVHRWRHNGQIPVIELPGGHYRISSATFQRLTTESEEPVTSGRVPLNERPYLLISEAMKYTRQSRQKINDLIESGDYETFPEGRRIKIIRASIDDYGKRMAESHRRAS